MANEGGGIGLDVSNIGGEVREDSNKVTEDSNKVTEDSNKVTEEAVRRVQDDQKKAQQVGQDIKNDKATNNKFANFLTFLLKEIKDDQIIKQIYQTFFKTRNEETDLVHLKKNMNTILVVGMFVPFYQEEIKRLELSTIYEDIFVYTKEIYLTEYIAYIKKLLPKYHDNVVIDKQDFTKLLTLIAEYYHLTEKLSAEKAIEFENTIKKELSLNK